MSTFLRALLENLLVSAVTPMGESVLYTASLLLQGATVQMSPQNFFFLQILNELLLRLVIKRHRDTKVAKPGR